MRICIVCTLDRPRAVRRAVAAARQLPRPKLTRFKNSSGPHTEIRRLWKRVWLSERQGVPFASDDDDVEAAWAGSDSERRVRERRARADQQRQQPRHHCRGRNAVELMGCCDGAAFDDAQPVDLGCMGACTTCPDPTAPCEAPDEHAEARLKCTHCSALLFYGEAIATKPVPPFETRWRGRSCCANGSVTLPAVERAPAIDALWDAPATGNLLKAHARQLNNALSLASAKVKTPKVPGGEWNPTVAFQGKLYHRIGPLGVAEGDVPQCAQYVHDPAEPVEHLNVKASLLLLLLTLTTEQQ